MLQPKDPISVSTISLWERGTRSIPPAIMKRAEKLVRAKAGNRFKTFRNQLGLSEEKFGVMLQPRDPILQETISNWEKGINPIPLEIMKRAEKVFKSKAGERFKTFRNQLDLSQEEFGVMLRPEKPIPDATISALESGVRTLSPEIMKLAEELFRVRAGARFNAFRGQLGVSQKEFGRMLRPEEPIPGGTISSWESKNSSLSPEMMKLAEELVKAKVRERFKALSDQLGLPRGQFGAVLRPGDPIPAPTISDWEKGIHPVPPEIMKLVEEVFAAPPREFEVVGEKGLGGSDVNDVWFQKQKKATPLG